MEDYQLAATWAKEKGHDKNIEYHYTRRQRVQARQPTSDRYSY